MKNKRPNIVIIHAHDIGQCLGCYGVKGVQSPNLDGLAGEGVRFARSFGTAPGCSPSRASIFTGRYPHSNGVMGLTHAPFNFDLNADETHLAQYLRDAGYRTAAVGHVHETSSPHSRIGYERSRSGSDEVVTSTAVEWLGEFGEDPERPFFMSVGYFAPHRFYVGEAAESSTPMCAFTSEWPKRQPDPDIDVPGYLLDTPGTRRELADLHAAVHQVDAEVGKVLSALKRLRLDQDTLVMFVADHGIAMPRAKCSLYDPGIEVTCILKYPGRTGWHGGIVRDEMISNVDYLPTILDLAGIPVPGKVQGKSLAPLLDGEAYTPRSEIFAEQTHHDYYDPRRAIRTQRHKLILNFTVTPGFMQPTQCWRPVSDAIVSPEEPRTPAIELYDLTEDPWELNNLADDSRAASVRRDLLIRLLAFLEATGDPILRGAIDSPRHAEILNLFKSKRAL